MSRLLALVLISALAWSCGSSNKTPTGPSSIASLVVTGAKSLTAAGQTVQLTATATLSDGSTKDVTATATWTSSNTGAATVSSGGLVTALSNGSVTITATYQGTTATATVAISLSTSGGNILTATVDGAAFTGLGVTTIQASNAAVPSGKLIGIDGASGFVPPYQILDITFPAAVGTYQLGPLTVPNGSLHLISTPTSSGIWDTLQPNASGTIVVTSLTASSASGTFTLTLQALGTTGVSGTKTVTNGVFNVKF